MRAGEHHGCGFTEQGKCRQFAGYASGFWVTCSDTIRSDSRVPFIPFSEERRQKEHAARWSTTIPCFRQAHSTTLSFWIQPVAATNEECLRPLKSHDARPEKTKGKMTNDCQDLLGLQVVSTGILQTQDAAFMAHPEVTKCR